VKIPDDLQGPCLFLSMLDSTSAQINSFEKLAKFDQFVAAANCEFSRLTAFATSTAASSESTLLAAEMAECWEHLADALACKSNQFRRLLMAGQAGQGAA
jgi:hypothetical protein